MAGAAGREQLVVNGDFERLSAARGVYGRTPRRLYLRPFPAYDRSAVGTACARIDITATGGEDWRVEFAQYRSLQAGVDYEVVFWARASAARPITLAAQKGSPDWRSYGLQQTVPSTPTGRSTR